MQKSYSIFDGYTFKQNVVLMDKPNILGFAEFELNDLLIYDAHYEEVDSFFKKIYI